MNPTERFSCKNCLIYGAKQLCLTWFPINVDNLLILTSGTEQYLITWKNKKYIFLLTITLTISDIQNRRSYLMTYLEDGRCSFSNNLSENAIRPFTVGRKNWLFCDTPNGAQASAIVYTMVEMAKANGVNVYHYLTYLLEKQPNDSMSDEELDQLAPWNEDVKAELKRRVESSDE